MRGFPAAPWVVWLTLLALLGAGFFTSIQRSAMGQTSPASEAGVVAASQPVEHGGNLQRFQRWIEAGGYVVLFALLFACGLGLPLPEDIPLLIAGLLISQGKMSWIAAGIFAWCGIIGGDCVLYSFGKRFGLNITRVPFVGKHLTRQRIEHAERLFDRWGIWVVAIGRLFAGIRGAMVVAAGATRYSFVKFIIADGLAAIVSGGMFMTLGWWAGRWFGDLSDPRVTDRIRETKHILLAIAIVAVVIFVGYLWVRRRKHRTLTDVALEKADPST